MKTVPMSPRIPVALVGRFPALLDYLDQLLGERLPALQVTGYASFHALIGESSATRYRLILLVQDRGLALPPQLFDVHARPFPWRAPVLLLSEQPSLINQPLAAGVQLVDMAIDAATLCRTLQRQINGGTPVSGLVSSSECFLWHRFTPKERVVLRHLSQGVSNKMIAHQMQLSESTIKFHMRKLFAKTGCDSRIRMALLAGQVQAQLAEACDEVIPQPKPSCRVSLMPKNESLQCTHRVPHLSA